MFGFWELGLQLLRVGLIQGFLGFRVFWVLRCVGVVFKVSLEYFDCFGFEAWW